jgi:hypothetical protein
LYQLRKLTDYFFPLSLLLHKVTKYNGERINQNSSGRIYELVTMFFEEGKKEAALFTARLQDYQ